MVLPDDPHGLPPGKYVRLSVTDTGLGMDEQTLARATEPFFTTKGIGKGTGLGLPMVHGLAAQSGGKLVLRSRQGEGTVVEMWLPSVVATEEVNVLTDTALAVSANEMPVFRPLSVLVVDDDSLVLVGTAAMLEDLGHTVILASSGKEALAILGKGERFDLVITDLAMPGMTGLQLAAAIKSGWPAMPIVVATGYSELAGDTDLPKLSKPFRQEDLVRALAACLQSARENQRAEPFSARTGNVRRRF
jgi:CheY-like chemotaxis protein